MKETKYSFEFLLNEVISPVIKERSNSTEIVENTFETLFGDENSLFDSFELMSFIFDVEDKIFQTTGLKTSITAEEIYREPENPFYSRATFARFLEKKLNRLS